MASRPIRRRRLETSPPPPPPPESTSSLPNQTFHPLTNETSTPSSNIHQLVNTCISAILPKLKETISDILKENQGLPSSNPELIQSSNPQLQSIAQNAYPGSSQSSEPQSSEPQSSTLQLRTVDVFSTGTCGSQGRAKPEVLGLDPKITAKILAGEFVKFSNLLPKPHYDQVQESKFHTVEKEGQLVFVKANDALKIRSINKWLEAFHVFVAISLLQTFIGN